MIAPARPGDASWRVRLGLLEFLPAFVVALAVLPVIIAYGHAWPWQPSTIDLQVYAYTVHDLLAGKDIYATRTPFWNLPFIYPPIAALVMIPLAVGPYVMWQVLWTAGLIWAQNTVLRRCGVRRGFVLALVSALVVLVVEPIRTTLGYGQINTFLMAFCMIDLLPDRSMINNPLVERRAGRILPVGLLTGFAASLKLTPALFLVFELGLGRRKLFIRGVLTFLVLTAIGAVFLPGQTVAFWKGLLTGNSGAPSGPIYVGNQSITGVAARLAGSGDTPVVMAALALSAIVALIALVVAVHWWRLGERVFAFGLVGMATCLASPLSWTHHHVWVLPLGIGALLSRRLPRWARGLSVVWAGWVSLCLMLMVLPYGGGPERSYTIGQQIIANAGPVMGIIVIVGLAVQLLSESRAQSAEVRGATLE